MPFTQQQAKYLRLYYLCAQCYEPVITEILHGYLPTDDDLFSSDDLRRGIYKAECSNGCGDIEVVGRVSTWWAEREGQKRIFRAHEIRRMEQAIKNGWWVNPNFDVEEALRQLGYKN